MTQTNTWNPQLYQDKHSFVWKFGEELLDLLVPKSSERILDVGCGTGNLTNQVAERGCTVLGIDRSAEMIKQAKVNFPGQQFQVADATDFTFAEPFDAVLSNAALHWVKPPEKAVRCIAAALKIGGRFVAEFGGKGNVAAVENAISLASQDVGLSSRLESPWYYPGIAEYATLLESHGMEVTFAVLFDRPTPLDGADGIQQWVRMFGQTFLAAIPAEKYEQFLQRVADHARPALFRDGQWIADYRRLRIVAHKRA